MTEVFKSAAVSVWARGVSNNSNISPREIRDLINKVNEDGKLDEKEMEDLETIIDSKTIGLNEENRKSLENALSAQVKNNFMLMLKDYMKSFSLSRELVEKLVGGKENVIVIRSEAGVYEVDVTNENIFRNPEMAINRSGDILCDYAACFGKADDYKGYLEQNGLKEEKDAAGIFHVYSQTTGKEVKRLDAFSIMTIDKFLGSNGNNFNPPLTNVQIISLKQLFVKNKLVPIAVRGLYRGTGPSAIMVSDFSAGSTNPTVWEVYVGLRPDAQGCPCTYEEYFSAMSGTPKKVPPGL